MPIFAFLTPSSLEIGLTFKGVTFLNKAHVSKNYEMYVYDECYLSSSGSFLSSSFFVILISLGLKLGDLLFFSLASIDSFEVINASHKEFLDFSWNISEFIILPMLILGLIESFLGLFIT